MDQANFDQLRREVVHLMLALAENPRSTADAARLNLLLSEQSEARKAYLDHIELLGNLCWEEPAITSSTAISDPTGAAQHSPILGFLGNAISQLPGGEFAVGLALLLTVAAAFWGIMAFVFRPGSDRSDTVNAVAPTNTKSNAPSTAARPQAAFARLTPIANCQWAAGSPELPANAPQGIDVSPGQALNLVSGTASIALASGVYLAIEGPVTLQLRSVELCGINRGRLFVVVPRNAIGFTVVTPTAEVVDLGTEFGIEVQEDGSTDVQVVIGEVALKPEAESGSTNGPGTVIKAGQAARVQEKEGPVQYIVADPARFTLLASSKTLVNDVPGQSLDVVDLLGGGDGTGHSRGFAIDPTTGRRGDLPPRGPIRAVTTYVATPLQQFVDGCFVPNRRTQVDSAGQVFDFPDSGGEVYDHIRVPRDIPGPNDPVSRPPSFRDSNYEKPKHGLLYMVPNKGLTLDLAAIRRANRGRSLRSFRAVVGISIEQPGDPHADVFVLVDGKPRFERRGLTKQDGGVVADVTLEAGDGFLTLATTDGGDGWGGDWVIFVEPQLELGAAN